MLLMEKLAISMAIFNSYFDITRWYPGLEMISSTCSMIPHGINLQVAMEFLRVSVGKSSDSAMVSIASKTTGMYYPLVNVYIAMERSTIFYGKIHYFYGHFQLLC